MAFFELSEEVIFRKFAKMIKDKTFLSQGIGWHIIAYKHLEIDPITGAKFIITTYHVFVMENSENQESAVNLALMSRSLEIYSKNYPQIRFCHITSDNAG